jgi:sugar lactone lactonase YvrE
MVMSRLTPGTIACISIALIAGCTAPQKKSTLTAFYPPPPEPPRLQYLTSYSAPSHLTPSSGRLTRFILGEESDTDPIIVKPYGLGVHGTKLFVCDTMISLVHVLDLSDRTWEYFRPSYQGALKKPINIAIDSDGNRYVADSIRGDVAVYEPTGTLLDSIGRKHGIRPVGVSVTEDRIYIADLNHRVCVFDKTTRALELTIPLNPDNEQERLFSPTNLAVDEQGNIYVSDTGAYRVQKYAADGAYLQTIGSHGDAPGQFARNKGIAVDRNGILYVVDAASQTVQMFDSDGNLLLYFGEPGASPVPLVLPADVVLDYGNVELFQEYIDEDFEVEYLVYVTSQYGARKVNVYGFGQKKEL